MLASAVHIVASRRVPPVRATRPAKRIALASRASAIKAHRAARAR